MPASQQVQISLGVLHTTVLYKGEERNFTEYFYQVMLSTVPPCLLFATFSSPTPKGNTLLALSSSSHLSKFLPTYRVYETYHVHCQYRLHNMNIMN